MASRDRRLDTNVAGEFYVDDTCIDCDTCRWVAPATFDRAAGLSRVYAQPANPADTLRAQMALLACPTASIGTASKQDLQAARDAFPEPIEVGDDWGVYYCGYHAAHSFGAASYFIRRPQGNVLVDSPRFTSQLATRFAAMGGVATLWLSHIDDVADHAQWAQRFGCERILHADDVRRSVRDVERQPTGTAPIALDDALTLVPVPGHTKGSACLLYRDRFCFTGDHLAWSAPRGHLYAFRSACWYDWDTQIASMERLAQHPFEWVLPGHGRRGRLAPGDHAAAMAVCIDWMRAQA